MKYMFFFHIPILSVYFQTPKRYNKRTIKKSLAIVIDAVTTFKWDPSTSCQLTGISVNGAY